MEFYFRSFIINYSFIIKITTKNEMLGAVIIWVFSDFLIVILIFVTSDDK